MGFTVWYRSSKPHSDADRLAIERAAADLCQGRSWLSCEPVVFFADSGDGRIVGGSKPNFAPHPEDIKSANATGLPDGTIRDAVDVLCQISRIHGVDWEITHQEGGDWIGHIRAGKADKELLDRVSALVDLSNSNQGKSPSRIPPLLKCLMGRNNNKKLKKLLQQGENPNEDAYVETALSLGNVEAAELLLNFGARPRDVQGFSTLTYAAWLRAVPLMSRLIDMGQDINGGDTSSTPLVHAAGYGDLQSVEFLISRGAAIDRPAKRGITPLMSAAFWGHAPVVRVLLERGANPKLTDESGRNASDFAALPWSAIRDGIINILIMGSNSSISEKRKVAAMFNRSIVSERRTMEEPKEIIPLSGFDPSGEPEIHVMPDGSLYVIFNFMPPPWAEEDPDQFDDFGEQLGKAVGLPVLWEEREMFRIEEPAADTIERIRWFLAGYKRS